ncbi:MAG: NAD(P)H-hydrate dehydratase, partial [Woeseiaceae bacterium]|nr:NAD(P)H-hydrate dehydratase [Woeseiaceae bacterium]
MRSLPAEIYSVAAVRAIDRTAIDDEGIPGYELMCRAGAAAVRAASARYADARRWQIVCGAGNNAGDGYVVARLAAEAGVLVRVTALVDPAKLAGDAATAHADFEAAGGSVETWSGALDADAELLVDALLGSGLERDVEGEFAAAVQAINDHPAPVLALDMPTGLHGDTGMPLGAAVRADTTITFVGLKAGLFLGSGPDLGGYLLFAGLDIPEHCRDPEQAVMRRIRQRSVWASLPPRRRNAHKGDYGHVVVIGGGRGMPGAVRLCGEAALRTGAGRVTVATHPAHAAQIVATCPELMVYALEDAGDLDAILDKASVVAFGPGLGQDAWAQSLFDKLSQDERPAVWDADALNRLARAPAAMGNRIVTPHPGAAATLLGIPTADVQQDRLSAVRQLCERVGGTVVLKGAGSLVSAQHGCPWICTAGNPGMAAPGMGDALTGVIAGLL